MSARELSDKQKAFVEAYRASGDHFTAYASAYNSANMNKASIDREGRRMLEHPLVMAALELKPREKVIPVERDDFAARMGRYLRGEIKTFVARSVRRVDRGPVYYVYALIDPRTDATFYVGKGYRHRAKNHVANWKAGRIENRAVHGRIDAIKRAGLEVRITYLVTGLGEAAAYAEERRQIDNHRGTVLNYTVRCEVESGWQQINWLLDRARSPQQWRHAFEVEKRRQPDELELAGYFEILQGHVDLRKAIRARMQDFDMMGNATQST